MTVYLRAAKLVDSHAPNCDSACHAINQAAGRWHLFFDRDTDAFTELFTPPDRTYPYSRWLAPLGRKGRVIALLLMHEIAKGKT
jgi:hypothetical protein